MKIKLNLVHCLMALFTLALSTEFTWAGKRPASDDQPGASDLKKPRWSDKTTPPQSPDSKKSENPKNPPNLSKGDQKTHQ